MALPFRKVKTLCAWQKEGALRSHIFGEASCDSQGGEWKSVSKIKPNFHITFFPSFSQCEMCYIVFCRYRQAKSPPLKNFHTRTGQCSYLQSLLWFLKPWRISYLCHLEADLLSLPFPLLDGKGESMFPAVIPLQRGEQIRKGCVTCCSYDSYLEMAKLVNSCSPLLLRERFAFCHTAYFNELHLHVV